MTDEVLTPLNPETGEEAFDDLVPSSKIKDVTLRHTDSDTGKVEEYGFTASDADHPLVFEDGYLTGTLSGSFPSPYTGRIENYELLFDGLPIDGIGGGSGGESNVEIVKITLGEPDPDDPSLPILVQSVDKTWSELEAAVLAGKTIIGILLYTNPTGGVTDLPIIFQSTYDGTALYNFYGEYNGFNFGYTDYVELYQTTINWANSDALPTVSEVSIQLQLHGGN